MPERLWSPAFIGLGSNLDNPIRQVRAAIVALRELPKSALVSVSSLYRSAPMGPTGQPDYVNAVAAMLTRLPPRDLLDCLIATETAMGRVRGGQRWGPRIIDLDLLVYGAWQVDEEGLQIPHPGVSSRSFVLYPLRELAPELWVPGQGRVSRLAAAVAGDDTEILRSDDNA